MTGRWTLLVAAGLIGLSAAQAQAAQGNADAGKKVFAKCAVCHGIGDKKGAVGPSLNNVIGRKAGTLPEFKAKYSKALVAAGEAGLVWDAKEINDWLTNPKTKVKGTKMSFVGLPNEQDRADVIAYISTFSKK